MIDEATQATAPSCWISLVHARRAVLVGDDKQLPPTIQNQEAARRGLRRTLFERLAHHHEAAPEAPGSIRSLLRRQYRMHETIMGFPNRTFYDGRLEADDTARHRTLADLGVPEHALPADERRAILDPEAPLVFVDTSGIDAPEHQRSGSHSRENPRTTTRSTALTVLSPRTGPRRTRSTASRGGKRRSSCSRSSAATTAGRSAFSTSRAASTWPSPAPNARPWWWATPAPWRL